MKYSKGFQKFAKTLLLCVYSLVYRIKITGTENIPQEGAVICANHPGLNDSLFVLIAMRKHELAGMAKKELFEKNWLAYILTWLGAFPIDRGSNDLKAIKMSINSIKDGKKLIIFPEGTRTKNSDGKAKPGLSLIATKADCAVVPIYINCAPKLFGRVEINILQPILPPKKEEKISHDEFAQMVLDTILKAGGK